MIWHILGYVALLVSSPFLARIGLAIFRGRARRRTWAGITEEAEARRLAREKELASFLAAAQREVDARLPGTPPIAPPVILPPATLPAPQLAANVAERPEFDRQKVLRDEWIAEESFHPTPARWMRLDNAALCAAYWEARRYEVRAKPGAWVLGSIRREMARRYGQAAVDAADRQPVLIDAPA